MKIHLGQKFSTGAENKLNHGRNTSTIIEKIIFEIKNQI